LILLGASEIFDLLAPRDAVAAIESALRAQDAGRCDVPQRHHIERSGNTFLSMPAVSDSAAGVKFVAVVPGNAARQLPVTIGVMLLSSAETGEPRALLDAGALTALRTGAVGALGLKYMTPADTASIGIVGCGVQGTWQAISACAVRPIREVFALKRSPASYQRFEATVKRHAPSVEVIACSDVHALLKSTSVVIAATTSGSPVLPDEPRLLEGKHFVSVGSYRSSMQELPDSVYRLAQSLAIDTEGARKEVGDIVNVLARGILKDSDVFPVVELVLGRRTIAVERTTAYKTAGNALFDLFVAEALLARAEARGVGSRIAL